MVITRPTRSTRTRVRALRRAFIRGMRISHAASRDTATSSRNHESVIEDLLSKNINELMDSLRVSGVIISTVQSRETFVRYVKLSQSF